MRNTGINTKRNFVYLKLQSRKHRPSTTLEWLDYFVHGTSRVQKKASKSKDMAEPKSAVPYYP